MRGSAAIALLVLVALTLAPTSARAEDTRAPVAVSMPQRVLRAVARRPRVSVAPAKPAPLSVARPAERATFLDNITRSVNDGESF